MIRWGVFVSGEGTNLQNFIDLEKNELKRSVVAAVHADRVCRAIERAKTHDKPCLVLSPKLESYEFDVLCFLEEHQVDRIFLLGYMRILSNRFFDLCKKPIVNLHPSLLPRHKGLHAIQKAFEACDSEIGVSIHEVIPELDSGRILLQRSFIRESSESLDQIEQQVHRLERECVKSYLLQLEK